MLALLPFRVEAEKGFPLFAIICGVCATQRLCAITAQRPIASVALWHVAGNLSITNICFLAAPCYDTRMAKKKRKPLMLRIRRRMPPPGKTIRDKSNYDRKREKRESVEEAE